ncbi:MAG: hypothetical protein ABII79_12660 [bacterium]
MPVSKEVKEAVLEQLQKGEPLMDVAAIRGELLGWLEQIPFPAYPQADSWQDCMEVFAADPSDEKLDSGIRLRLTLPLYTGGNRYLLAIMESLVPASRGTYFVSLHVNWKADEWRMQKSLEEVYTGRFDDALRAGHTLWAQTFHAGELAQALNCCAIAILAHELVDEPCSQGSGDLMKLPQPAVLNFPSKTNE